MKYKHLKILLLGAAFCLSLKAANAQSDLNTIYRFLDVTPAASASGLGGNHSGLYDGNHSQLNINPAYLFGSSTGEFSATFVNYLADARLGITNAALQLNENNFLGFGIRFVGYGDFQTIDENGNVLGDFNALDVALTTAYATKLLGEIKGGVSIDLIHSSYEQYKSSGIALAGGIYYKNEEEHFSLGASVRNLGTQFSTYNGIREPMPLDVSIGIAKKPQGFPAEISFTLRRLNDWDMRTINETETPDFFTNAFRHVVLGGTFDFSENFHIRLGYNRYLHDLNKTKENFDFAGIGFGVGFLVKNIIVDISRNSYSETGGIVQFSIKTTL